MNAADRNRFDGLLEEVLSHLPEHIHELLDEVPLIVDDLPSARILKELGMAPDEAIELCGLHTGIALTERSVNEEANLPNEIRIFREGIVDLAGGWDQEDADDLIYEQIWITVLHEIGHQFGLDEEDLANLGYE